MSNYSSPGVYVSEIMPPAVRGTRTGIPVFLGLTDSAPNQSLGQEAYAITCWAEYKQTFGGSITKGFLSYSLRGFFQNDGELCYVLPLESNDETSLRKALRRIDSWDKYDLICAPDLMLEPTRAIGRQRVILDHCEKQGDCFAILDALPGSEIEAVLRQRDALVSANGALYYPWIIVNPGPTLTNGNVPSCGHIAGIYARSDKKYGVHKAPANEILAGVADLEFQIDGIDQQRLNPFGINCLRFFAGRGIRVWGARTLSGSPDWNHINVRRLFLTIGRWCECNLADLVFELNQPLLWDYIKRALKAYFTELYRIGALQGDSANEAFYVSCDAQTNSAEVREQGRIVTEIGLAVTVPNEYVVMRIIHNGSGLNFIEAVQYR